MNKRQISLLETERKEVEEKKNPYIVIAVIGVLFCFTIIGLPIGILMLIIASGGLEPMNKKMAEIDNKLNRTTINNFFR